MSAEKILAGLVALRADQEDFARQIISPAHARDKFLAHVETCTHAISLLRNPTGTLNLNRQVRVRLTARGQEILANLPRYRQEALWYKYDQRAGVIEMALWEFCQVFGPHFYCGCTVPTQDNTIEILPENGGAS